MDAAHPYIYPFDPQLWTTIVNDHDDDLTYFQRQFGERGDAPNLPRNDTIVTGVSSTFRQAIGSADYLSLRLRSEDIHNLVHRWVGGNMLRMTSPNDPVFFMHHAAIDRMWSIWQRKVAASGTPFYQQSRPDPGHKLHDAMIFNDADPAPFTTGTTIAQVIDGHAMHGDGVWYESDIPELTNDTGSTLSFTNIPEGLTSYKAVKFRIKGCRSVHFRITGAPTGNFGLTTMGTEFIANPDELGDFFYGYVWVQLTAAAGPITPSGVNIHAYIIDEEGYYAASEGGEYPIGDYHVDLEATTVPRENNAIALVLDRSGSMADPVGGISTKSDLLRNAIQVFRDLMLSNDEIAVVTFDNLVDTPITIQQVGTAPAFSTIDITPRNTTWIGGGIQQGAVQLAGAAHTNRSMIVLTDGNENVHPYIGEIDPSLLTNRTYAIGFGVPGTVSDAALNQITSNSHGDLIITGNISTNEQRFDLTKYFVQVLAGVTKMDVILDPQGSLYIESKHVIPFRLTEADVYADIIVLCPVPKVLDFLLETPAGKIIKPTTTTSNIQYIVGQQVVFYRMALPPNPMEGHEGEWKAILSIKSADEIKKLSKDRTLMKAIQASSIQYSLPYSFIAHTYSNLNLVAYKHQESLKPGSTVTLFASLEEYNVTLPADAVVWAEIINPHQSTLDLKFQKFDEKTYSASFKTTLPGVYLCRIRAEGLTRKGLPFTRERIVTAGVYYGDYNPLPEPKPGIDICQLFRCLLSEETLSPAAIKKLSELGINLKYLRDCFTKICPEGIAERPPNMKHEALEVAQKKQLQITTKTIEFSKASVPKPLKPPAKKIRKPQPEKKEVNHFPPLKIKANSSHKRENVKDQEIASHFPPLGQEPRERISN